ncbi:MAG TPA: prepilin-type N-terminal cleavage/methylation domain-containing protein [Firmicutes bacterium]|jgi:prepilin-type N-terminal cleavage/methylation domain-containing protein|nr:prepilin-type N-terminal cleavage/methylation domain-containing protein [Bacillota bacterium]
MNRQRGFTLVELLLALALAALVMAVVGTMIFAFQRRTMINRVLNQQQETMIRTLHQIREQLREATAISLTDPLAINPASIEVTLPPIGPGHEARKFNFGYQEEGRYVWLGEQQRPGCQHIQQLRLQYEEDRNLLLIQLQSDDTIHGSKQGLPLILETSVILRNAGP